MKTRTPARIVGGMNTKSLAAFLIALTFTAVASADPESPKTTDPNDAPPKLTLFTSTGYLGTSGGNGAAVATGIRYAIGDHFALGFDLGYGLMAMSSGMQDRWWLVPSMAVVLPANLFGKRATFDIGVGLGLGTASGYASWSEYSAHPFTADWEVQLEPAARAHAIAAMPISKNVDLFVRGDAAALVLPHGSRPSDSDGMWLMLSMGARFRLL